MRITTTAVHLIQLQCHKVHFSKLRCNY